MNGQPDVYVWRNRDRFAVRMYEPFRGFGREVAACTSQEAAAAVCRLFRGDEMTLITTEDPR